MHWIPTGQAETFRRGTGTWKQGSCSPRDLIQLLNTTETESGPIVLASFLQAQKAKSRTQDEIDLQATLCERFTIPKWLWQAKDQDSNGYFYGASLPAIDTSPLRHVSVFRFMIKYVTGKEPNPLGGLPIISYDWHILTFVVYSELSTRATLLCFNIPEGLQEDIEKSMTQLSAEEIVAHPFVLHDIVLEHVVELYDKAIWQFRDFVRLTEKQRPSIEKPRPHYVAMHELGRHVMHSSEVLSTALNVISNLLDELDRLQKRLPDSPVGNDPGPDIRHKRSMLQFMQNRSEALEGRLKNEIGLAFHITAQHSSEASTQIAQAAKIDSSTTKTISILGLVFLPGTFISAIFSMSFFNFTPATDTSPAHWRVSEKFWIYWVVTIPVTAITIALWFWWQKSFVTENSSKSKSKQPKEDKSKAKHMSV